MEVTKTFIIWYENNYGVVYQTINDRWFVNHPTLGDMNEITYERAVVLIN